MNRFRLKGIVIKVFEPDYEGDNTCKFILSTERKRRNIIENIDVFCITISRLDRQCIELGAEIKAFGTIITYYESIESNFDNSKTVIIVDKVKSANAKLGYTFTEMFEYIEQSEKDINKELEVASSQ